MQRSVLIRVHQLAPLCAALLLGADAGGARASGLHAAGGVTIVRDDASGLTLEYAPPAPVLEPTADPAGGSRVAAVGHVPRGAVGAPDLPATFVQLGVPFGAAPRMTIEFVTYAPLGTALIAPAPSTAGTFDAPTPDFARDAALYEGGAPFPSAAAEMSEAFLVGPQRVGALVLSPARWNPRTGALEAVTRLRVRIDFPATRGRAAAAMAEPPRDRSESLLSGMLANYETARGFREAPAPAKRTAARSRGADDSFASSPDWVRLRIATKGVHRITYEDLVAAGVTSPTTAIGSTASLRLYNGGGLELPEDIRAPRVSWMRQIPLHLQDGGDGRFDPGDAVLFYALALNGFFDEFDPSLPSDEHFGSRYGDENVCWLTWGGSFGEPAARVTPAIDGRVVVGSGALPAQTFLHRTHEERDIIEDFTRFGEDGYFWTDFRTGANQRFVTSSPGADPALPATLHMRLYGHHESGASYIGNAIWNADTLADTNFVWNDVVRGNQTKLPFDFFHTGLLATGRSDTLRVRIFPNFSQEAYMCWFELAYQRRYDALGQKSLLFTSGADTGLIRYDIAGFTPSGASPPILMDVTDPFSARLVMNATVRGDSVSFEVRESGLRRYALWDESALLDPSDIRLFPIQNLRNPATQADYVMIVADQLQTAASSLRSHRSSARGGGHRVLMVPLSQIVAQFGWGISDPTAIRDFIQYAVTYWDNGLGPGAGIVPEFVVLVGDATKDYRGLRQSANRNLLPAHYRLAQNGTAVSTFATDDWFTYLGQDTTGDGVPDVADDTPDIAIGRLPVQNTTDLQTIVSKIVQYEANPEFGDWRTRVVFVADDEMKGCGEREMDSPCWDQAFLGRHTGSVEDAALRTPDSFDRVKVYLTEYPFGNAAEKPAAKRAYLNELKKGALVSHYSGHGSIDKMADENVFTASDADATRIGNGSRYYIFTAYSCSIGTFDLAELSSISERLLRTVGGGSIASFSSSAPAFDGASTSLAVLFVSSLFVPPSVGEPLTVGEAVRVAKSIPTLLRSRENDEKYIHLGDPGLRFAIPEHAVQVDSHGPFTAATFDSVSGAVVAGDTVATWFDGSAFVTVEGVADTSGYFYYPPSDSQKTRIRYELSGGTLFRGEVPVVDGHWKAGFYVPIDLRIGNLARVRTYVANGVTDGLGIRDSLAAFRTSAVDSATAADQFGPQVVLTFDGRPYRPGITVLPTASIVLRLSDPHGINLQGDDDFFAVSLTLDERTTAERTLNLTGDFRYESGKNDVGSLAVPLSSISGSTVSIGRHRLTVQASDNLNNRSVFEAEIEVVGVGAEFRVSRAENYPNPFSDRTEIHYTLTQNADVTVRIFTVNGRMIREFRNIACGSIGDNDCLEWDGLDQDGDPVANGVYFFKVLARSLDSDTEGETIGKAVVMRK